MRRLGTATAVAGLLVSGILVAPASAATITLSTSALEWDLAPTAEDLDDLSLTLSALPTNAISNLLVTFRLRADLDAPVENVTMSIDGFSFGIWLDDIEANDAILGPAGDSGGPFANQSAVIFTGTATIPLASLLPLLADGQLTALFNFSIDVDDLADPPSPASSLPEFAEFSIQYDTEAAVPEPATLGLFAIGLAGLRLRRRAMRH